jgi:hypothetical protein
VGSKEKKSLHDSLSVLSKKSIIQSRKRPSFGPAQLFSLLRHISWMGIIAVKESVTT